MYAYLSPAFSGALLVVLVVLVAISLVAQKRAADEQARATQALARALEQLTANSPAVISADLYEKLHGATFAILDEGGHPVCCGFFVTPCGVALTAAHACEYARLAAGRARTTLRASTYRGEEFTLDVVAPGVGDLDVAVLRVAAAASAQPPGRDFLPLPSERQTHQQLMGAPVTLIHGSIAWSTGSSVSRMARDNGTIITSNDSMIQYSVSPYKGHSGAALLFRGGQVIGLHSGGFNDLAQEHSETTPATSADAVRLDVPQIWRAVQAAKVAAPSAAGGSGMRRRTASSS